MNFFSSWESLIRVFVIGILTYITLIIMLKYSGNRTLSQMNSFDFIITIAMGSTFSSGILDKSISFVDTVGALFLLIMMQFTITKLTVKSKKFDKLIKANPVILYYQNEFQRDAMMKERIGEDELLSAVRESGISTLSQVEAIILETNGNISAIPKQISSIEKLNHEKSYRDATSST